MNIRRVLHKVMVVLLLSAVGLLFYYAIWLITDEEFRQDFLIGSPIGSWGVLADYISCCLFTTGITVYYWHSREKTEKERDRFRLQALENQLSPHFVFNNFSILAELIEVNPKKASAYLMNLSKVYRYTLSHLDHATVSLQEELEFLNHYLALLKERFGESIKVKIAPDVAAMQGSLPPAALQILIENAIKHNEHTTANPLVIDVEGSGNSLCVINRKRMIPVDESSAIGQRNIIERYRLLTKEQVIIKDTSEYYNVSIPLIPVK